MKKRELIYVVLAERWGGPNEHAYVAGASTRLDDAKKIAKQEVDWRGGKYAGVVYQCPNGVWIKGEVTEVYRAKSIAG